MSGHSSRFLEVVDKARAQIKECTVEQLKLRLDSGDSFHLIDVREQSEFAADHLPNAIHLGKGVIERDIEKTISDTKAPIVLYCGGGYRSALAAQSLQQMGYTDVTSMDGGIRGWRESGYPLSTD